MITCSHIPEAHGCFGIMLKFLSSNKILCRWFGPYVDTERPLQSKLINLVNLRPAPLKKELSVSAMIVA